MTLSLFYLRQPKEGRIRIHYGQQLIHPVTESKLCFSILTLMSFSSAANEHIYAEVPFLFPVVTEHLLFDILASGG